LRGIFASATAAEIELSEEVGHWFSATAFILKHHQVGKVDDRKRQEVLDALGNAAGKISAADLCGGFSERKTSIAQKQLLSFFQHGTRARG